MNLIKDVKVGLQTISWGQQIQDIGALAKAAKEIGYQGLEFAQRIDALGPAENLKRILEDQELQCIGLAGGALEDRVEYAVKVNPDYLLQMEWDSLGVRLALDRGLKVVLHPHWHKGIDSIATAEHYLKQYPDLELGLAIDTAHMFLCGDNVLDAFKRHTSRIFTVHLKDWTSSYGTSPFRFAKGFVPLGEGELGSLLKETVDYLLKNNYKGWYVVEQDYPNGSPVDCARISYEWFHATVMSL